MGDITQPYRSSNSAPEEVGCAPSRASNRKVLVVASLVNAVSVLSLQLLGLVTLTPTEFGLFSIQYLIMAFATSVGLSVVCEPWLRMELHENYRSTWPDYSSFLLYVSVAAGVITVAVSLLVPEMRMIAISGTVAVIASNYRSGARYYQVRMNLWNSVLWADVAGLVVTVFVWIILFAAGAGALTALFIAWALGAVASASFPPWPKVQGVGSLDAWVRTHKQQIKPLLKDSLLMDLGAIGTPFAVAPVLGIASFGVYRAVSNAAAPVRLVLNPLRPTLAGVVLSSHRSSKRIWASIGVSLLFGGAAYGGLVVVDLAQIHLGSLTALVAYAVPVSIFVAASFLGHYYYIIARVHMRGAPILVGRIVQTALSVMAPLAGAVVWGVSVAIWGFALATALSAVTWFILVLKALRPDPH